MVNVLIADDNVDYAITLMNYINEQNNNIRVCNITKDGKETLKLLNLKNNIDIILLDYQMPYYNGIEILENLREKDKYIDSCIIVSGEIQYSLFPILRENELIHAVISKTISMLNISNKIKELADEKEYFKNKDDIRSKILNEVIYLGYDISHKGTQYLISAIEYIFMNNSRIDNLEKYVYPEIARLYNDKPNNVKCRINTETNEMYCNCKINKLKEYFHFDFDEKPKVKYVIATIINKM